MSNVHENNRRILFAVDDNDGCERAVTWAMDNLYRRDDEVHLVHVIPRMQLTAVYGAPPVDLLPQQDPVAYEQLLANAERFMAIRFLHRLQGITPNPVVHIIKSEVDTDSIGHVICKRANELQVSAIVMASRSKTSMQQFFKGSVTDYCTHHCALPVIVVH